MTHLSSLIGKCFKPGFFNWAFALPKKLFPKDQRNYISTTYKFWKGSQNTLTRITGY